MKNNMDSSELKKFSSWLHFFGRGWNVIWCSLAVIVVILLVGMIMQNPQFRFGDDQDILRYLAKQQFTEFQFFKGQGRLTNMQYMEFWLLKVIPVFWKNPAFFLYLENALIFVLYAIAIFSFIHLATKDIVHSLLPASVGTIIVLSSFPLLFWELVFPEKMVCFLCSIFLLCYWEGRTSKKFIWFLLAFLMTIPMLFYKETAFCLLLPFPVLLLPQWRKISMAERFLLIGIAFACLGYLALYYFGVYLSTTSFYGQHRPRNLGIIWKILQENPVIIAAFLFALFRVCRILFFKECKRLFFDAILFGGLLQACAYLVLCYSGGYYFSSCYLMITLSGIYFLCVYLSRNQVGLMVFCFMTGICFAIFYWPGVWNCHVENQKQRATFIPFNEQLFNLTPPVEKVFFYQPKNLPQKQKIASAWRCHITEHALRYLQSLHLERKPIHISYVDNLGGISREDVLVSTGEIRFPSKEFFSLQLWGDCFSERNGVQFYRKKTPKKLPIEIKNLALAKNEFVFTQRTFSSSGLWMSNDTILGATIDGENDSVSLSIWYEIVPFNICENVTKRIRAYFNGYMIDQWTASNRGQHCRQIRIPSHLIFVSNSIFKLRFECDIEASESVKKKLPAILRGIHLQKIKLEKFVPASSENNL